MSLSLEDSEYRIPLRHGEPGPALRALRTSGAAIVSEPLARKADLSVGDTLFVATQSGAAAFPIAAVSYDYSSEAGAALISRETMERHYGPAPVHNVALFLKPGASSELALDRLRERLPDAPLEVRSNADIRREVFRIFDQTFAITRLLQGMALLIASAGITLTLLVLARERVAELALYRALGAQRRQIFRIFVGEGLGLGVLGLGLGVAGGLALALILIHVINPAFFGWTIHARWPWTQMLQQGIVILAVCGLASVYPALRATRVPARELSRDEL
jgi:putative ABC transport system permease protein